MPLEAASIGQVGTAVGAGDPYPCSGLGAVAFQVIGEFTALFRFEGSLDGENWFLLNARTAGTSQFGTQFGNEGIYIVAVAGLLWVRSNIPTYTDGTLTISARGTAAPDNGGGATSELQAYAASATLYAQTTSRTGAAAISNSQPCVEVLVQADPDNTVDLFVGNDSTQPIQLKPGAGISITVDNVSKIFARSADGTTSAVINWIARS